MAEAPIPGWYLEAALKHVGWAQADLAEALEIERQHVNRWIKGGAKNGIPLVTWYGCLMAMDLPKTWRPKAQAGAPAKR